MSDLPTLMTFLTFKKDLIAGLKTELPSVQIKHGYPGDVVEQKAIWLGDVQGQLSIPTMKTGRKARDESYTVNVTIDVARPGKDVLSAEEAAVEYLQTLESLLADNVAAFGGVTAAYVQTFREEASTTPEGAYCRIEAQIAVTTRLR